MLRKNAVLKLKQELTKNRQIFESILEFANDITKENPQALVDLIRLIGKRVQSTLMSEVLFHSEDAYVTELRLEEVWFKRLEPITQEGALYRT